MKSEKSVNALSKENPLSSIRSRMFHTLKKIPLPSNVSYYAKYYSIADTKEVGISVAL